MLGLDSIIISIISLYCFFFSFGKTCLIFYSSMPNHSVSEDWSCVILFLKHYYPKLMIFMSLPLRWLRSRSRYFETSSFLLGFRVVLAIASRKFFKKAKGLKRKGIWLEKWNLCLASGSLVSGWANTGSTTRRRLTSRHNAKHIPPLRKLPLPLRDDWSKHRKWCVRHKVAAQCAAKVFIPCHKCAGWRRKWQEKKEKKNVSGILEFWSQLWKKVFRHPSNVNEEMVI